MSVAIVSISVSVVCHKCNHIYPNITGLIKKLNAIDCLHLMNGNDIMIQPYEFTCEFCHSEITVTNISNDKNQPLPF